MKAPPRRQQARSQATRDEIVGAALGVFALKGYAAASMDDVCLAAGCSKGGLYHHFPTKSAVLSAVVERLTHAGALLPPFETTEGALTLPSESIGRVLLEIWAEAARDETLRAQLRAGYESCLDRSITSSSSGQGRGLADILRIGTLVQLLTRADGVDTDEAARRLGLRPAA